jgi:hypothetical protein
MKKNQKIVVLIGALVLIFALIIFLMSYLFRENSDYQKIRDLGFTDEQIAEIQEIADGLEMENRQIKVEMATEEELTEIGLVTDTSEGKVQIQVIERDESGKIISYKIIRQDEDIANEIAVPKRGFFTEGGVVPFLEE